MFPDLPDRSEVHVWKIDTGKTGNLREILAFGILSIDEQEKVHHFRRSEDALRYATSHFYLRKIMAGYCKISPESVSISKTTLGKPALDGLRLPAESVTAGGSSNRSKNIEFSISHSRDLTVISIVTEATTGVDLEYVDTSLDPTKLYDFCLSAREKEFFSDLGYDDRLLRFLRVWTAKEAALKYLGIGLTGDLRTYECRYRHEGTLDVWAVHEDNYSEICRIIPIPAGKDYVTALAIPPQSSGRYRIFSVDHG